MVAIRALISVEQANRFAVPPHVPVVSQVTLSVAWAHAQAMAQLLDRCAADLGSPLPLQPGCQQGITGGGIDLAECLAIQPITMGQVSQGEFAESALGDSQLIHALA